MFAARKCIKEAKKNMICCTYSNRKLLNTPQKSNIINEKKISHLIYVHANWIMSCTNESNPEKS